MVTAASPSPSAPSLKWAKVVDHTRCIGCHACTTACKSENEVPLGVTRTYVKSVDVGVFPQARRAYQVTRCNQCEDAPCVAACPTAAMYKRRDGIVDFAKSICIGCKACMAACPYDAIFINPVDHSAEKCNVCAHRLDVGLAPACVVVCPTEAILVGDLADPRTRVSQLVQREAVAVRRPEKETRPLLFYKGAHQYTLDPLAARRPAGGLFMWSEQSAGPQHVVAGNPSPNSSAAAVLSYDVPHRAPWDWRVSLYTWTKGVAAGAYLTAALLVLAGLVDPQAALWRTIAPAVSLVFLAITGGLLISDLEHPRRFYLIFTRPQWRSWLVKGAFIIAAYGAVLVAHVLIGAAQAFPNPVATGSSAIGVPGPVAQGFSPARLLMLAGVPLAALTAIYTAYLFAQSKGRDLWQSPLLPAHMLVQAIIAGSGVLIAVRWWIQPDAAGPLSWILGGACVTHLLLVLGETTLPHVSAHARLAVHEMVGGRFATYFWTSAALTSVAVLSPWIGAVAALPALIGLAAYEHAYVQAAQAVPLA